jgi:predicted AlkP superfamily phosphohydrolase/phosphomutase
MATVNSREIVDAIIKGNGYYPGDREDGNPRVIRIVQYQNQFNGGIAYGLIYEMEPLDKYHSAGAVHNPKTIWDYNEDAVKEDEPEPDPMKWPLDILEAAIAGILIEANYKNDPDIAEQRRRIFEAAEARGFSEWGLLEGI